MPATELTVPQWTYDDFLNSDAPYEWLYQFHNDPFKMNRMMEYVKAQASSLKIRGFANLWKLYIKSLSGEVVDSGQNTTDFDGLPLKQQLMCGKYICDSSGVSVVDGFGVLHPICSHPIAPIRRFKNVDTGEELLEIWYRRGTSEGKIKDETHIVPKNVIANGITGLAQYGIAVSKKNDKDLSAYLMEMEQYNYDVLDEEKSVKRLGWVGDGYESFSPYVDHIFFDGEDDFGSIFAAVTQKGSYDTWKDIIRDVRKQKTAARYYLAASFSSAILKPCGLLPYLIHVFGGSGNGKAQPLYTRIITPDGYKLMGDIEVGDMVIGGDGKAHPVIGVYPQGKKDVYRLTFSDGSTTECCKEHLWNVSPNYRREHGKRDFITMSLEEMMKRPIKGKKGYEYRIQVCKPVEWCRSNVLPIHPYALGALIGDGCLGMKPHKTSGGTYIYFSNTESDVVNRVNSYLSKNNVYLHRNPATQCEYVLRGGGLKTFKQTIVQLGLNKKSVDRFIPSEYMYSSVEDRLMLLRGLMDTDGLIGTKHHACRFDTKSRQLALDVQYLCRSLGYRATFNETSRGEYVIRIITDDDLFLSDKHKSRKSQSSATRKEDKTSMAIVSVDYVGEEECQCIMVDSEEHTYLCDDFIVTHNTVLLMLAASVWADPALGEYVTTFNGTRYAQETRAGFLNTLPMCLDELQIQTSQGVKDFDDIIYQLCEGVSKTQGKASGGLRKQTRWRNVILSNGEHTIIKPLSGGGARNRVVEIEAPDKIYPDLVGLCDKITHNYGHAGKEFVEWLMIPGNMERVRIMQRDYYNQLTQHGVTEKQAGSASAILTADAVATEIIFKDGMNLKVEEITEVLLRKGDIDIHQKALDWLYDFVATNQIHFDPETKTEFWGRIDEDNQVIYIIRNVLEKAFSEHNLDLKSFLSWALRTEKVLPGKDGPTKPMKIPGTKTIARVIQLKMPEDGVEPYVSTVSDDSELPF